MPLYDFVCLECNTVRELLVRSTDHVHCPTCGTTTERMVSKPQAPGKSGKFIQRSRAQAAKEGHFSHFSASERPKVG